MDKIIQEDEISNQALLLVEKHFKLINEGNLSVAKKQLFHPPELQKKPLDVYIEAMEQLKPFNIFSIFVKRTEKIKKKRHGRVATVWITIEVGCKLGNKTADISVWWFPDSNKMLISGRPSHWILGCT